MVNDEDIYYSTNPKATVKWDLKKCNQDLLDLILIYPVTKEIQEQIDELNEKIMRYGVRGIFESFYELHIFI